MSWKIGTNTAQALLVCGLLLAATANPALAQCAFSAFLVGGIVKLRRELAV